MPNTDHSPATISPCPRLDEPAPEFTAATTLGVRCLSDYRGKWLVMFSHPADFTPVCTSEFIAFQKALPEFNAMGCELLGLSVDSIYSHLAWLESIKSDFGINIEFPVVEDISMAVSFAYGMIHENSVSAATARSVFVMDPDGILRALIHYPISVGRNVAEILRLVNALQLAQKTDLLFPEGWKPGDKAVQSPLLCRPDQTSDQTEGPWYYREVDILPEAAE